MSAEKPPACHLHPESVVGVGPTNRGQCWDCEGRPPHWVCVDCRRHFPCEHVREVSALTREEADAYCRVMRAAEAWCSGASDRGNLERALRDFQRRVRGAYGEKLAKASMN